MQHDAEKPHLLRAWFQAARQRMQVRFVHSLQHGVISLALGAMLLSGLAPLAQAGWGIALPVITQASSGTPNRFNPHADTTSVSHTVTPLGPYVGNPATPGAFQRNGPPSMQPGMLALHPGQAGHFLGSDGRLEVNVPGSAITVADVSQAGGQVNLEITQVAPASGSNAGGSGHISFGTYLVQIVDGNGKLVPHGLRQPVTLTFHYGPGSATDLSHAFVIFNSALPAGTNLAAAPASVPAETSASMFRLGAMQTKQATLDSTQQTLSVTATLSTAATSASFDTDAPVAVFGKPDPFNTDLNAGALTFTFPIEVPTGPGGLTPPLVLTYSSDSVSEQHNIQGSASWVGEGWDLSLGSISWAEHNVAAQSGGNTWESSWQLSDPFGTSAELIPSNVNVSTYYDDTPNIYYNNGSYPNEPIRWYTATESHDRIYSYVGPNSLPNMPAKVSCFRVWLPNGLMEEFGCTPDAVEYYYVPSNLNSQYIAEWLLDLVTDPQGNQIHITYQNHMASLNGVSYTRDVQLKTIEWDAPNCHSIQSACIPSWQPLMRVNFVASHTIARLTNSPSGCNTGSLMRCDNPLDLSSSGGTAAPEVQNTFALNDLQVQVRSSSSASWNTLKDYQFSYEATGPSTVTDPTTGLAISHAGEFDLTQLTVVGDDGSTALPTRTFSYTAIAEHYEDAAFKAIPSTNCGWSWNSGCFLWSQSHSGNSRYLTSASNGLGLTQTFSWAEARNNTHGVNSGGSATDPLYCDSHQSGYPCNLADDENWSHVVLTSQSGAVVRPSSGGNSTVTSTTNYSYQLSHLGAQPCSDCTVGYDWGDQNDLDYLDYYNGKFMGFTQVTVTNPDGSVEVHHYKATGGWGVYDASTVTCISNPPCHSAPWWSSATALHGREFEADFYDTDGSTLLKQVQTQYQVTCPPSGDAGTPGFGPGQLRSMLDPDNPVVDCDIHPSQVDTYTYDGASSSLAVPHQIISYTYDKFGNVLTVTTTSNDGGTNGSPTTIVQHNDYIWNISITANSNGVTGQHLINFLADSYTSDAGDTIRTACSYISYDGQPYATGQQSSLTLGEITTIDRSTSCGTSANNFATSGLLRVNFTYDQYGHPITVTDPDANAGNTSHLGCVVGSTQYSVCFNYDSTFDTLPLRTTDALNQSQSTGYSQTAGGGFGLWPTSTIDTNGQTTTTTYDALGRPTSTTLPGETSGLTTTATSYTAWCSGTSAQTPCIEVDTTQRQDSGTTVISRAFYDGWGHLVETRTAAPGGQDVVQYAFYDPSGRQVFLSIPYFVAAYTGGPGATAFVAPDASQPGTSTTYTNLQQTTITDALSHATKTTKSVECGQVGDSACYIFTATVDPLNHQQATYTDALGRETYLRSYTGNSGSTYAAYETTMYGYDAQGNVVKIVQPDGTSTTTYTYDDAGRVTGMSDPDRGTESYSYDQDGNLVESIDARGSVGTVYMGYDALDRPLWRNTLNSATGAYVVYSYDGTTNGNEGIGRLTGETFTGGPGQSLSGSYSYVYDVRGRQTSETLTIGGTNFSVQSSYNDADQAVSLTYPDGEVVATSYTSEGWLNGVTTTSNGITTPLLNGASYTGVGGASGQITSAQIGGGGYQYTAAYDALLHLTDLKWVQTQNNTTLFEEQRTFDGAGNVTGITTTLPQGTDKQQFCYDEQDRLTWAGSTGTPPCTSTAITPGSLTSGAYTQNFSYDQLGRLTSGPLGSYTYGDSAHLHAVTQIGSNYTATYDAAGDMICRAPTSSTTCAGSTPTSAQLSYDNEGRLIAWQNAPANPTSQTADLYDGEGQRVEQRITQNGSTTTIIFISNLEEVSTTGSSTTTTTYYYAGSLRFALAVNGAISYLATDGLGSASVAFDTNGNTKAAILYTPYGQARYASGTLPTDYDFAGQQADATTGLYYMQARYYDPIAGQFISADTELSGGGYTFWSFSRYAYVGGNPETVTDPSGHDWWDQLVQNAKQIAVAAYTVAAMTANLISPFIGGVTSISPGFHAPVRPAVPTVPVPGKPTNKPPKKTTGDDDNQQDERPPTTGGDEPSPPVVGKSPYGENRNFWRHGQQPDTQNQWWKQPGSGHPANRYSPPPTIPGVNTSEPVAGSQPNWWMRDPGNTETAPTSPEPVYNPQPTYQPSYQPSDQPSWWSSNWGWVVAGVVVVGVVAAVAGCVFAACIPDFFLAPAFL